MKHKKLHPIFHPTAEQLVKQVSKELRDNKPKFDWKEFYKKLDKELIIEMKKGDWKKWKPKK